VMEYVKGNCGFTDLSVVGTEYAFGGIPSKVAAGPAVITFDNDGNEVHEVVILKVKDGVTESMEELLALPENQARKKLDPSVGAGTFAVPGETGYTAVEFTPGRYAAICFVTQGMTMEVMEDVETGGTEPEGAPHFMAGMVQEFEVA
jgi:plastocyanin